MATYEINYKSDFTLVMGFTLAGVAVPLPVGNFRVVFRTQEYGTEYECSRINGEYVNCQDNGNDTLLCIFDRHGLRPGALRGEVYDYIPDTTFPDGSQLVVTPSLFDIELVEGAGNTSEGVTAEVIISVEEVVGQARDAALAAENAAESANAAADSASDAADRANDAADAATEAIADLDDKLAAKQDTLVSGENIKTINNESLLGSGNITIQGGEQVQSDWAETDSSDPSYILNKPTLATVATSGSYNDLSNKPTIPDAQIQSDWSQSDNTKKDYIKNKPTIPAAQVNADWNASSGVAAILNKPTIPTVTDNLTSSSATDALSANQGKTLKGMLDTYCPIIEDTRSSAVSAITGVAPFSELVDGQMIVLRLKYMTANSTTLNLTLSDGTTTGAKPIYSSRNGQVSQVSAVYGLANGIMLAIYDNTNSRWNALPLQDTNTTYSTISQAEINAGTGTGNRVVTPALLVDNFEKRRTYVDNSADASVQLAVTTYNDLGTLSAWKTITLPASYDRADEFVFRFVCGDASLTPTLPQGLVMADNFEWSEMAVGVVYQVSICDGIAAYLVLTPQNP